MRLQKNKVYDYNISGLENIMIFSKISKYRKYGKYYDIFFIYFFDIFHIFDIFQKMKISNKLQQWM